MRQPEVGEGIRVLFYTRAAREEGMEAFGDYLARGMPAGAVAWLYVVEDHSGAKTGRLLEQYGPVIRLSGQDNLLGEAFGDFAPDVVHANLWRGAYEARRRNIASVCTVHGMRGGYWYGALFADISVGVSPAVRRDVGRTILHGIIPLAWPTRREPLTVAWLGRLDEDRQPEIFLDALAAVPEASALVIGRANRRAFDVNEQAAARGISDRVVWLGHLPAAEARREASKCGLVVSTVDESFGFATAELMTAGVRPVVVAGEGYQVQMADGWGKVASPEGLGDAISEALSENWSEGQRKAMAEAARTQYSAERMATEYLGLYREVIRRRHHTLQEVRVYGSI